MDQRLIILVFMLALMATLAFLVDQLSNEPASDVPLTTPAYGQWELPRFIREASGLAVLDEGHLLLHEDEQGFIYRLALEDKSIERMATIGQPVVADDFEGIALDGDQLYLVNSSGLVYGVEAFDRETVGQTLSSVVISTGLKERCEIEGLHVMGSELLLPCKTAYLDKDQDYLTVFSYEPGSAEVGTHMAIEWRRLVTGKALKPTAISSSEDKTFLIASRRLIVIGPDESLQMYKLPKKKHPQPEGLAVLQDGSIVIVEDNRKGRSRLTHYESLASLEEIPLPED